MECSVTKCKYRYDILSREHYKLPQWGPGQSPSRKRILVHFELGNRIWQQLFRLFLFKLKTLKWCTLMDFEIRYAYTFGVPGHCKRYRAPRGQSRRREVCRHCHLEDMTQFWSQHSLAWWPWPLTLKLVHIIAREVGNLSSNFGVSETFRSQLIGQHLSDAPCDCDLWPWRSWHLSVIRVLNLYVCTKFWTS